MRKIVFASDRLGPDLDDRTRQSMWHEAYAPVNSFEVSYLTDRPFSMRAEFLHSGKIRILKSHGTIARLRRTSRHVATDGDNDLSLTFNSGRSAWALSQLRRDAMVSPGMAILSSHAETCDHHADTEGGFIGIAVPPEELLALVANAEDLINRPLDAGTAPIRFLRSYLELILGPDGIGNDEELDEHVGRTLLDLMALALGAGRDVAELARMRGLRAARLRAVLQEIKAGFADPECSPQRVALKLGLSARYVQDLLHETGGSFTERVMELRLQRARSMLASPHCDHLKIIDIASGCGFNEVSYFNRRFRARFGASPREFRSRDHRAHD